MEYDESGRPSNLAHSAVLKLLEEEEEKKRNDGKWSEFKNQSAENEANQICVA